MIIQAICNSYREEMIRGIHSELHTYKMALYTALASLDEDTTEYTSSFEVVGSGYTAGGKILTGFNVSTLSRRVKLKFDPVVWPASSIQARGALIYNASAGNKAVEVLDFGEDVMSVVSDFTVTFTSAGVYTIGKPKRLVGDGSPEGTVAADPGTIYWDKLNKSQWVKETEEDETGWYQQFGPSE